MDAEGKKRRYICKFCSRVFTTQRGFAGHKHVHTQSKRQQTGATPLPRRSLPSRRCSDRLRENLASRSRSLPDSVVPSELLPPRERWKKRARRAELMGVKKEEAAETELHHGRRKLLEKTGGAKTLRTTTSDANTDHSTGIEVDAIAGNTVTPATRSNNTPQQCDPCKKMFPSAQGLGECKTAQKNLDQPPVTRRPRTPRRRVSYSEKEQRQPSIATRSSSRRVPSGVIAASAAEDAEYDSSSVLRMPDLNLPP